MRYNPQTSNWKAYGPLYSFYRATIDCGTFHDWLMSPRAREEAEPLMLRAADAMFHLILIDFLGARSRRSYNARLDTSPPQAWILVTSTSRSSWNWRLRPVWPPIYGVVPGFLISGAAMGTARMMQHSSGTTKYVSASRVISITGCVPLSSGEPLTRPILPHREG